jgi:AraC family transcriptional regulator, arabinose operon regulatory protein
VETSHTHIYVWDRLVFSLGPGRENTLHRHFGAILTLAPDAPIAVTAGSLEIRAQAALITPNALHRMDGRDSRVATLLVGPDHPWFCYVKPLLNGEPVIALDAAQLGNTIAIADALFTGQASCESARTAAEQILRTFGGVDVPPHRLDERIEAVLRLLHEDIARPPRLAELGQQVGLSAFTLMRRFKRELGVRIGEYVLWRRMMSGLTLVDGRTTVADIAQSTGFYDQAHFSRTVRRMVSLPPSLITDMSQTRVHVCGRA